MDLYGIESFQTNKLYPRVINERQCKRLVGLLESTISSSHSKILVGGEYDIGDLYIAPTIVHCSSFDCDLMKDEIFEPILPVLKVDSIKDAIDYVNSGPEPLMLYTFSPNLESNDAIINQTISGGCMSNDLFMNMIVRTLPFGGIGNSGLGGMFYCI